MRRSFIYRKATPLLCGRLARCPQLLLVQEDEGSASAPPSESWLDCRTLADSDHGRGEEGLLLPR